MTGLGRVEEAIAQLEAGLPEADREQATNQLVTLAGNTLGIMQELALVQARSRLETVTIDPIELKPEKALEALQLALVLHRAAH